jgi:hypothetical protein
MNIWPAGRSRSGGPVEARNGNVGLVTKTLGLIRGIYQDIIVLHLYLGVAKKTNQHNWTGGPNM